MSQLLLVRSGTKVFQYEQLNMETSLSESTLEFVDTIKS